MVTNEENDSEPSEETNESEEERPSPSRDYSAGQSRPTSRGRPDQRDDEDDQEKDTTSQRQNREADRDESRESQADDSADEIPGDEQNEPSEESERDQESPDQASTQATESDESARDSTDDSQPADVSTEQEPTDSGDNAESPVTDDVKETSESTDEEETMYDELDEFRGFSIFEGLGPEAINIVVEGSERLTLRDGEKVFEEEDDPNDCFYLVLEGEIKIMKFMRTETTQVTTLEEGDYFGEFGMFTGNERMAGAESRGATTVLEIPKSTVRNLRKENAEGLAQIYENMFQAMAKRFKALAQKAEKSQFWL